MTDHIQLETAIDVAWEARETLTPATRGEARDAVEATLAALDDGSLRVAEKLDGAWTVRQWAKKAVLLSFRLSDNALMGHPDAPGPWWDKVPGKFAGWGEAEFRAAGFRARHGAGPSSGGAAC